MTVAVSQGTSMHLADVFLMIFPQAWKGRRWREQTATLLIEVGRQVDLSVEGWPFRPLRKIPVLLSATGRPRHTQDVHKKEELMDCARRAGFAVTASRLKAALWAYESKDGPTAPNASSATGSSPSSSSSPGSAGDGSQGVSLHGAFAMQDIPSVFAYHH